MSIDRRATRFINTDATDISSLTVKKIIGRSLRNWWNRGEKGTQKYLNGSQNSSNSYKQSYLLVEKNHITNEPNIE
ncbi:hypothetical protein [Eubacterium sp. AB3007]|jgi:hypothetical protein|uniref:hypothetical protein n=1 Tax=Eubacterium sp. AB3007 TaxID=1392487 RepID=UPI001639595E|nr:hypothetical protein [Eubacterium sp. AB3007]